MSIPKTEKVVKATVLVLSLLAAATVSAKEANVLLGGEVRHSGYGAPTLQLTHFDDNIGVMTGVRGGWIINDKFVLGLSASGLVNSISQESLTGTSTSGGNLITSFGYCGLLLEYYLFPHSTVHVSVGAVVGAGGLRFSESLKNDHDDFEGDVPFVAEPEIGVYLNVTSFFRIGLTVSYRLVTDVDTANVSPIDLSGFAGGLSLSFGAF